MRTALALGICLTLAPASRAGFLYDLPADYKAGSPFAVGIRLGPVSGIALYDLDVTFRVNGSAASLLGVDSPTPAAPGYLFPVVDQFFFNASVVGTDYRLTISDFTLIPPTVDVTPGGNDRLVVLTVRPAADLIGPIRVLIDARAGTVDPITGDPVLLPFGGTSSFTLEPRAVAPVAGVPEPAGALLLAVGAAYLALRRRVQACGVASAPRVLEDSGR